MSTHKKCCRTFFWRGLDRNHLVSLVSVERIVIGQSYYNRAGNFSWPVLLNAAVYLCLSASEPGKRLELFALDGK